MNPQGITESIVGPVDWQSATVGFCRCPGEHLHHTPTRRRDCRVCIDGAPTVHCLHASCAGPVADANRALRRAMRGKQPCATWTRRVPKPCPVALLVEAWRDRLPEITTGAAWTMADLIRSSPIPIPMDPTRWWPMLLGALFDPGQMIWAGDVLDVGPQNIRPARRWAQVHPPPFVAGAVFRPGGRRCKESLRYRTHVIIESDRLPIPEQIAVLAFLARELPLAAITYSGGKSLHAWFWWKDADAMKWDAMRKLAPHWGLDPKTMGATQPVRAPGAWRASTGRWQRLLFLNAQ
jgi:hypothetical protein